MIKSRKGSGTIICKGINDWRSEIEALEYAGEKFLNRKKFLYQNFPDLGVQEMNDELKLLFFEQLCQGVSTIKEIKNLEVYVHLVDSVSKEERNTR